MGFVYLACPYTDKDEDVRIGRFEAVAQAAGVFVREGVTVYAPVAHCHPIALTSVIDPCAGEIWLPQCFGILDRASALVVLMLPGWEDSKGIRAELDRATERGIPCYWVKPFFLKECAEAFRCMFEEGILQ